MIFISKKIFYVGFLIIFISNNSLFSQKIVSSKEILKPTFRNSSDLSEKDRNAIYKKTKTQLKAACEQYKKQCTRIAELLAMADDLGKGNEESDFLTRDLRSFFNALGDAYTSVIDTITGTGNLKQRIEELELAVGKLKKIISVQNDQLKELFEREQKFTEDLSSKQLECDMIKADIDRLEKDKNKLIGFINKAKILSAQIIEGKNFREVEKGFVKNAFNKLSSVAKK